MLNYFWIGLILISIIVGAISGNITAVTEAAINSAKTAVELALGLIGVMTLWLGLMQIAEKSGIIKVLAKLLKPVTKWLFPGIPADHPAIGSMLMNILANWFGLANAATPLGLKAMKELQEVNTDKESASNAMVIFMGLNTATICFIPATMIAIRASAGAANPAEIIGPTILSSICATIVAVTVAKLLSKLPKYRQEVQIADVIQDEMDTEGDAK